MALTAIPTQLGAMLRELGQIEEAQALHQEAHDASQRLAPFMLRGVESQLALDALSAGEVNECERWLCQAHAREPLGEIGTALQLSEKTVRNYVSIILGKLGLSSRAQAAAYAARHRIEDYL